MVRQTRASSSYNDSSDACTAESNKTVNTRRSHKKSRNGCIECKRRHIRCDERRPSCANCDVAERACVFLPSKRGTQRQKEGQQQCAKQHQDLPAQSSGSGVGNHRITNNTNNDDGHTEMPLPTQGAQFNSNHATPGDISEYSVRHSNTTPGTESSIGGLDNDSHKIASSASPIALSDSHTSPAKCLPGFSNVPESAIAASFTPQHMVLLHHANSVPNFTGPKRNLIDIAIRRAIDSTYLLDEILAFTAFHLSSLYPGSAEHLRTTATELQNRALASFTRLTELVPKDDKATAVPRFLFSAILGRHVLAETLVHCRADFHSFIDRLVDCFNLNRGITSVTPPAREYLYRSEVRPFIGVVLDAQKKITSSGIECDPLSRLLEDSDLSETSVEACRQAIGTLQWSFDICRHLEEDDYPQSVSAFSVKAEASFVDMLRKHRPEALVILAYFGVLLHRCRGFWAFGDAGEPMIRAIAGYLGSYWQEALAWPLHVLETERTSASQGPSRDAHAVSLRARS